MSGTPDVVVVGSACRDLVEDDPRGWRLGGGASYAALALARLGLTVGATVVADDLAAGSIEIEMIRDAGVDVRIQPGSKGPVFINHETPTGRIQQVPQVSDPVDPAALPAAWREAGAWMFAPVAAEIPDVWAAVPPADAKVALGWQGLLRVLVAGERVHVRSPFVSPVVWRANLVGVGADDIAAATTPADLATLLQPGAEMLFTDGVHGGDAYRMGEGGGIAAVRRWRSIPIREYVDPVGAGDSFLSGVFAAQVRPSLVAGWHGSDADLRLGAACGSLILEGPGLYGVPYLKDAIERMSGGENPD
ncbi:MAG TPA: PfkB family carbohydrate kinase [Candidatus Limnocylindrales bacterium]